MRLALITGGSSGLGLALCQELEKQRYQIFEFSRRAPHSYSIAVDLRDPLDCAAVLNSVLNQVDPRSVAEVLVINNAGILAPMVPAAGMPAAAVVENLHINLVSGVVFLGAVCRHFQDSAARKCIANITSGAAERAFAGWSLYCAAKAAMEQYIRVLALEQSTQLRPWLAVNISPGVIDTQMQAQIRSADPADFPEVARFVARQAQGELRAPGVVAKAVLRILGLAELVGGARYAVSDYLD